MTRDFHEVPQMGLMRISEVLRLVPVSRSNWWGGVKVGKYPAPVKLSPRVTCWRASDILDLIERAGSKDADAEKGKED